jgi:hypothetical protein
MLFNEWERSKRMRKGVEWRGGRSRIGEDRSKMDGERSGIKNKEESVRNEEGSGMDEENSGMNAKEEQYKRRGKVWNG